MTRVVFLHDVESNSPGFAERIRSYARAVNVEVQLVAMRDPKDVTRAFAEFGHGTSGLLIDGSSIFGLTAEQICKLALQRRLPSTGAARAYADAGCLMSYAENQGDMFRRAAVYVDKIRKGAKPADLPVEQAAKFDLVINLKTAKALGLTIPPSLLGRADEVIE
jgi:putative ABC transport system substrate-binding protein